MKLNLEQYCLLLTLIAEKLGGEELILTEQGEAHLNEIANLVSDEIDKLKS